MINRRRFLKTAGLFSLAMTGPSFLWKPEAKADLIDIINYSPPSVMPQIIHVFLYGGPSELAGNLTNIEDNYWRYQRAVLTRAKVQRRPSGVRCGRKPATCRVN